MASEDFVSYNLMRYLQSDNWHILQYHPPGGQACLALKVFDEIVYPDIVSYKGGYIFVIENKPRYSNSDILKLEWMLSDEDCKEQLIRFTHSYLCKNNIDIPKEYIFLLGHGYSGKQKTELLNKVNLLFVNIGGNITINRSLENSNNDIL